MFDIVVGVTHARDDQLDAATEPFDSLAGEIEPFVVAQSAETRDGRQPRIQAELAQHDSTWTRRRVRAAKLANRHHDGGAVRTIELANGRGLELAVADDEIGLAGDETIAIPFPPVGAFMRLEVMDRPEASHSETARGAQEAMKLQESAACAPDPRDTALRPEIATPDALGPVKVDGIDVSSVIPQPGYVDLEVVGGCNAAFGQRGMEQCEVRVALLRDTDWKGGDSDRSRFRLSSVERH